MTVRMLMQFAGVGLLGASIGYTVAICQAFKTRRQHKLQVDHLRKRLKGRVWLHASTPADRTNRARRGA